MAETVGATACRAQSSARPAALPVAALLALQDLAWPPGGCPSPRPRAVWGRTKEQFSAAVGASVPMAQPEPGLPLRPALLNGYKLEDKSSGFQAILSSISGNCRSPALHEDGEGEKKDTESIGPESCSKQTCPGGLSPRIGCAGGRQSQQAQGKSGSFCGGPPTPAAGVY